MVLLPDKKEIKGRMRIGFGEQAEETGFIYALSLPCWHLAREDLPNLRVDDGKEKHWRDISSFLDLYPPILVLDDGNTVINGCIYKRELQLPALPSECLDSGRDWSGCDIHVEFECADVQDPSNNRTPAHGMISVNDQVEKWLKAAANNRTLIVKDHGSGEIADFIEVDVSSKAVRFYHCKACSPDKEAGARIDELKALEQVLRSINHIGSNILITELHSRVVGNARTNTRMVKGSADSLKRSATTFQANQWDYEVVLVSPGIDGEKALHKKNTNTLLVTCYEWLAAARASFKLICQ
jgi:hypothetical protein